jgi:hypothetical protein
MRAQSFFAALLVLILTVPSLAGTGLRNVLFEDFQGITPPALPSGWVALNANGDLGTWETRVYGGVNWGRYCIRYAPDPFAPAPADDWFFTHGVTLSSGDTYTLEFQYKGSSAAHVEAMSVYAGTTQDPLSMSVGIWSDPAIMNDDYLKSSSTFTVPVSGTYYLGFHAHSGPGQRRLFVDDINLLMPETGLELRLSMTQSLWNAGVPTYTAGDTVECFITIENIGAASQVVYKELSLGEGETDTQMGFDIIGPDAQPVPFICKIEKGGPPTAIHYTTVDPDSMIGKVYDLWHCYGFEMLGSYTIEAHYKNYADPDGIGAWKGELMSDPVVITLE